VAAHIQINDGDDWVEVFVDGEPFPLSSGHSINEHDLVRLLRSLGHTVDLRYGDFDDAGEFWEQAEE
jgi:hypothetical protein